MHAHMSRFQKCDKLCFYFKVWHNFLDKVIFSLLAEITYRGDFLSSAQIKYPHDGKEIEACSDRWKRTSLR